MRIGWNCILKQSTNENAADGTIEGVLEGILEGLVKGLLEGMTAKGWSTLSRYEYGVPSMQTHHTRSGDGTDDFHSYIRFKI